MIRIRQMEKKDILAVQQIATVSWHATYEGIIPIHIQRDFLQMAYNTERLISRLEHSYFYIAYNEEQLIGFANFSQITAEKTVELEAIYLHPHFQGQGIGSMLLHYAIERLQPVQKIFINVEQENQIGRSFYKAKGFQTIDHF